MTIDPAFWSGQRVLLTGHTGFKGAWLALWLTQMGAKVTGFSLPPETEPNLFRLLDQGLAVQSLYGDLRDAAALAAAVEAADPTIVLHLAAQTLVRRSYREPLETFETNVMGTARLLDLLRDRKGLQAILVITTDKVYRNNDDGRAFLESDPLGGHDPYSASKAATEIAVASWLSSFFHDSDVRLITGRAGNVIGGGDWSEDRLVPDIWRAVTTGETLTLRYPDATRPWQHVIEPVAGYLRYVEAAVQGAVPPSLNFGPYPDDVRTVRELAEGMLTALNAASSWRQDPQPGFTEAQALSLDPSLAADSIGWRPRLDSGQAIAWTAEWYGRLAEGEGAAAICVDQISRYEALI